MAKRIIDEHELSPVATGEVTADEVVPAATRGRSPSQILWLKLRRNRTAMFGLYILIVLYASAILA
ncbi:MAG TPA: hypothetical protein VNO14_15805, partial [Blastocatellia bacterium]|nr:hypothetical protein [Blastocatellia bacterium]